MKNIVVLVSGGGTNLQALIDDERSGNNPNGTIKCVISSKPDVYALERAKTAGIKTIVLDRKEYENPQSYSQALLKLLLEEKADLIVYAGFMTILDSCICEAFENKMINVHPSLLPAFGGQGYYGLKVHEAALKRGVKISGATVHFVTGECDGGPIISQKSIFVKSDDTPTTLQERIMKECEQILLPQAVRLFSEDKIKNKDGMITIL